MKKVIIYACAVIFLLVGCTKNESKEESTAKITITPKAILEKSVEYYKGQNIKSLNADMSGKIVTSDKNTGIDVSASLQCAVNNNEVLLNNSYLALSTIYKNKTNKIELYFMEDGSIGYVIDGSKAYDASNVASMLGIKYTIPVANTLMPKESADVEVTTTPEVTSEPVASPTNQLEDKTSSRNVFYKIDDLINIYDRIQIKGNKEIDGRKTYVLKGQVVNNEIINFVNASIEGSLYELPKAYGNIIFSLYVDVETYEIRAIELDMSEVVKTLSGVNNVGENILTIKLAINKGTTLTMPKVQRASIENVTKIWNVMKYYSNIATDLKGVIDDNSAQ